MEKILEGNELIAEFMEVNKGWADFPYLVNNDSWKLEGLKYHSSWDWLMPVWIKISTLIAPADGKGITVHEIRLVSDNLFSTRLNYRTKFQQTDSKHQWFEYTDTDPLRATWCVIIQFIQWYNKTKQ